MPDPTPTTDGAADARGVLAESGLFNPDGSIRAEGAPAPSPEPAPAPAPSPEPVPAPVPAPAPVPVQTSPAGLPPATPQAAPQPPPGFNPAEALARALAPDPPEPQAGDSPPEPDPDLPPDPKADKANHRWAELRARVKEAEAKIAEYEGKAKSAGEELTRAQTEFAEKLAAEQAKVAQLEESLGRISLENSPKFKERYDADFQAIVKKTANTLTRYGGVDEDKAVARAQRILRASPEEIVELVKELPSSVAGAVITHSSEAQALMERRQLELDTWRESQAAAAHDEARESMVAKVTQRRDMANAAIQEAINSGVSIYDVSHPQLAERAQELTKEFMGFAQAATPDDLMRLAAMGHAMPAYLDTIQWYARKVEDLEANLRSRAYAGAVPAGGFTPSEAPPRSPVEDIQDPMAFAKAAVSGILTDAQTTLRG